MGYDKQNTGSSGPIVAVILLLVFLVLAGLFLLGIGAWFFLARSSLQQRSATLQRQAKFAELRAMGEELHETADAHALKAAAELKKKVGDEVNADRQIVIELDKQGELKIDGESTDLKGLTSKLRAALADDDTEITVNVRADNACPYQHVVAVISSCQDVGITRFRMRSLDPPGEQSSLDAEKPATVVK